ncbi:helix-turn-helix domain-containing protein [Streptomyces sporangiiformans]|uniref:helix-turn-helix domain-containing protein n=1 Tax=Streptomyces sporangiiformans TaxID=2315329 RepID=UPI003B8A8B41
MAGMSADYYARIEQQRGPVPSESILAAIARALHLTLDGDHLFRVAGHTAPGPVPHRTGPRPDPPLVHRPPLQADLPRGRPPSRSRAFTSDFRASCTRQRSNSRAGEITDALLTGSEVFHHAAEQTRDRRSAPGHQALRTRVTSTLPRPDLRPPRAG